MTTDLISTTGMALNLQEDLEASRRHYQQSWASATLRGYRSDWRDWESYCVSRGADPLPSDPVTVAGYLSALAEGMWGARRKLATIERRRAAIAHIHVESGNINPAADPRVARVMVGIRRQLTVTQSRKAPARSEDIRRMVAMLGDDPRGVRNRALLLVGFATACRRSELVALRLQDLREHRDGLILEVHRSKTDQVGEGHLKLVRMGRDAATCPVRSLRRWLAAAKIERGYIFRSISNDLSIGDAPMSARGVARAVQGAALAAGLNPTLFGGHSLRAGYVTEADSRGARTSDVMAQTGHQTMKMISTYTRYNVDEKFASSTALDVGL